MKYDPNLTPWQWFMVHPYLGIFAVALWLAMARGLLVYRNVTTRK